MATPTPFQIEAIVAAVNNSYSSLAPDYQSMGWYVQNYYALFAEQGDNPAAEPNTLKAFAAYLYELAAEWGEVPIGPDVSPEAYVQYLYHTMLGRAPDASGLEYWTTQLSDGNIERAELAAYMLDAAVLGADRDAAYVQNRALVAIEFAQWPNSNPHILDELEYGASEILVGVNEDPLTVLLAQERLYADPDTVGNTFRLTTEVDAVEGTPLDDAINAYMESASTLTELDSIDGGGGWDALNIFTNGSYNAFVPATASIVNVNQVNIFNASNEALALPAEGKLALTDAAAYEGVRELWQMTHAVHVHNLGADTVAGFSDVTLDLGRAPGAWSDVIVHTLSGTNEANIALQNVMGFDPAPDSEERVAFLGVRGDALDTVNLTGFLNESTDHLLLEMWTGQEVSHLTLTTEVTTFAMNPNEDVSTFDGSASTGDIWLFATDSMTRITTGGGNDVIVFNDLPTLTHMDGGAGFDVAALDATRFQQADYDALNQMTNIEGLAFVHELYEGGEQDEYLESVIMVDAAQLAQYKLLSFGLPTEQGINMMARVSNLGADQTLAVARNDSALIVLENAAANFTLETNDGATAGIVLHEQGLGEVGGVATLIGEGRVVFSNAVADNLHGKFHLIDASELEGQLELSTMAADLGETVIIDHGNNIITLKVGDADTLSSSTQALTDMIVGFNSDISGNHDVIWLTGNDNNYKTVAEADVSSVATLEQAFAEAASEQYDGILVFFLWEGDTFLFANTDGKAGVGEYDFTLLVGGEHDFNQLGLIEWTHVDIDV